MRRIEIISIPVTDQARAKEFYQKLGFEVIVEAPFGGGSQWVQMGFPGQDASITLVNWFPKMPAGCIQGFVIKTNNVEDDIKELTAKGIESRHSRQHALGQIPYGEGSGWECVEFA